MAAELQVRVTGLLTERGRLLVVRPTDAVDQPWRIPETLVRAGETLADAVIREIATHSGYRAEVVKLVYLTESPDGEHPHLHVTFECRKSEAGASGIDPSGPQDVPAWEVRWISVAQLTDAGFSPTFAQLMSRGLPDAGSYVGAECNLGF